VQRADLAAPSRATPGGWIRRGWLVFALAVASIILGPASAQASVCGVHGEMPGIGEATLRGQVPEAERWDVIFAGVARQKDFVDLGDDAGSGHEVTFDVVATFKRPSRSSVVVYDQHDQFEVGRRYFVSAGDYPDPRGDERLATSRCTATYELASDVELALLRAIAGLPDTSAEPGRESGDRAPVALLGPGAVIFAGIAVMAAFLAAGIERRRRAAR
jgi:hypothetical protein